MLSARIRFLVGRCTLAVIAAAAAVTALAVTSPAAQASATQASAGRAGAGPARAVLAAHSPSARSPVPGGAVPGGVAAKRTFRVPVGKRVAASAGAASAQVSRSAGASPQTTITCTLYVFNPFYEATTMGEEGDAEVQCTGTVTDIFVEVGLYQGSTLVSYNYTEVPGYVATVTTTYNVYAPGYYQDGAVATIYYPSGYSPPTQNLGEIYSQSVYIF